MTKIRWASMKWSEDFLVDRGICSRKNITKENFSSRVWFCFLFFFVRGGCFCCCFFIGLHRFSKGRHLHKDFFVNNTKYSYHWHFILINLKCILETIWNITQEVLIYVIWKIKRSDWWTLLSLTTQL